MNVDNGVDVPTAQRLKAAFDALTEYTRPATQLAPLIAELGEALEQRFAAINSTNAAVIGRMENTLRDELVTLRAVIAETRAHNGVVTDKLHNISNHLMAFENKLNELAELLTAQSDDNATA